MPQPDRQLEDSLARPPDPKRRAWLLGQVRECFLRRGLADTSLRSVAAEIGVSHRTLLHHFGTKERMLVEVIADLRRASRAVMEAAPDPQGADDLRAGLERGWRSITDLEAGRFLLLFEVWVLALRDPERWPGFVEHVVADWLVLMQARLRRAGVPEERVAPAATLAVAAMRGLALDHLTDRSVGAAERTGAAVTLLGQVLEQMASPAAGGRPPGAAGRREGCRAPAGAVRLRSHRGGVPGSQPAHPTPLAR